MLNKKIILRLFLLIIVNTFFVISIFSGEEGNPDNNKDKLFFRDVRIDGWTWLLGDDKGILSVMEKLENMYGSKAPKIKIDLANPEFSDGNWHYEFSRLAEKSILHNDFLAAAGYYSIAAYPEYANDKLAYHMYDKALECFQKYLKNEFILYKLLKVNIDGFETEAYLVYPKSYKTGDKVPVILETGGIDGQMIFNFPDYLKLFNKENFAWAGFDQHRLGTSRNIPMTGRQADNIFVAVIKKLKEDKSIDSNNIFVYGRSFGGFAATRLIASGHADELNVAGVIADPPMGESAWGNKNLLSIALILPPNMKNVWAARIGANPNNLMEFDYKTKALGLQFSKDSFWGNDEISSVPLLVQDTAFDPMCSIEDIIKAAKLSKKGEIFLENAQGHCTDRPVALKQLARFIKENKR